MTIQYHSLSSIYQKIACPSKKNWMYANLTHIIYRCGTESKAFLRSKKIALTSAPSSRYLCQSWVVAIRAVVVDLRAWNPH